MSAKIETNSRPNPYGISPESVTAIETLFENNPQHFERQGHPLFEEMTTFAFQVFRIGEMSIETPINDEDKAYFNLKIDSLTSIGNEEDTSLETEDIGYDWLMGINSMRSFVWSVFHEESNRTSTQLKPNNRLIDPQPIKREDIPHLRAPKKGMFIYERESLEEQWQSESPEFYDATIRLRDMLSNFYASRMLATYTNLPEEFVEKIAPEVHEDYKDSFMNYALRTYVLLAPISPELFEVKTR